MEYNEMETSPDYSMLPPHIISIILSHLYFEDLKNAVQVCSLWYYASHHPVITKRIRLRIVKNTKLEIPDISQIQRPFDSVRISHVNFNKIEYKEFFTNFGKFINTINIAFCKITIPQLYEILIYLRNLKFFEFFECKTNPLQIWHTDHLNAFDEENRDKIVLNLGKIKYLTFSPSLNNLLGFIPIFRHTKNLEKFCLRNTWALLPANNELIIHNLFEIFNYWNLEKLKSLEVEYIGRNKNKSFYDSFLKLKNIQLKELRIIEKHEKEQNFNTDYYNQNFTNFCKQNQNLDILEIPSMNDQELYDISRYISKLKHLEVGSTRVDRIQEIRNFKALNVLHLCRFSINSSEEVVQLFSFKFDHLKKLWLELYVGKDVLDLIAENCELLESLSLKLLTTDCESIFKKLSKLKYLRLWFPYQLDDTNNPSKFNITNFEELEYLEINGYAPGISAQQIESLPKLKYSNHKFFNHADQSINNTVRFEEIYDDDDIAPDENNDFDSEEEMYDDIY